MTNQRPPGVVAWGISFFLIGIWIILSIFKPELLSLRELWPVLPIIAGVIFSVQYFTTNRTQGGLIFLSMLFMLAGLFLLLFTLHVQALTWVEMRRFWPVFLIIIGLAFSACYLGDDFTEPALLRPAYLFIGLGVIILPFTMGLFPGPLLLQIASLGPLPLVLAIILFFFTAAPPEQTGMD